MLSPSQSLQYLKESIERASMCTEWILSRFSAYRRLPVKGMPSKSMLHMQKNARWKVWREHRLCGGKRGLLRREYLQHHITLASEQ